MTTFIRKNLVTLLLAASLGLNVTLAVVLLTQPDPRERFHRMMEERFSSGGDYGRADWRSRTEALPDSIRQVMELRRVQIDSMQVLRREALATLDPLKHEIGLKRRLLWTELMESEPSQARLDSLTGAIMREQYRIQKKIIELLLMEREVLTPEQYRIFLRLMSGDIMPRGEGESRWGRGGSSRERSGDRREGGDRGSPDRSGDRPPPPPPWH